MDLKAQADARAELEADLVALKRHGVKHFAQTAAGFDVEFWPPAPSAMPEPDKKAAANDPDICACGHQQFQHMNGYCVECPDGSSKCEDKKP